MDHGGWWWCICDIQVCLTVTTTVCTHHPSPHHSDTVCDLGGSSELANYGEYSGAPSESQTYDYAKTILGLMTEEKHPRGICLRIHTRNFSAFKGTFGC